MSATLGKRMQDQFSQSFVNHAKVLQEGGSLLEVGSGYGVNLKNWADEYENAIIIGIDIDPLAIEYSKKLIEQYNWKVRVENIHVSIHDYVNDNKEKFDVIVLNHVLHEMEPDENYRKEVLNDLHSMLKRDGLLIVGEHMIPEIFAPKQARHVEIMHKWLEVGMNSRFYDEESFRELINSTHFKKPEFIGEGQTYFWALRK